MLARVACFGGGPRGGAAGLSGLAAVAKAVAAAEMLKPALGAACMADTRFRAASDETLLPAGRFGGPRGGGPLGGGPLGGGGGMLYRTPALPHVAKYNTITNDLMFEKLIFPSAVG